MKDKKEKLSKKERFYEQLPEQGNLTGTALASVAIFLREEYSMLPTRSEVTLDSNDETTRQILDRHTAKFSKAWKTLAQK